MSVKFVQDVEITSGNLELSNGSANNVDASGSLNVTPTVGGSTLRIGNSTDGWKGATIDAESHNFQNAGANLVSINNFGDMTVTRDVEAASFAVPSGTSSGFLKADGSIDTTSYSSGSGVTGAGTDNTIPLWNGTGAIDNSCITETTNDLIISKSVVCGDSFGNLNTTTDEGFRFEAPETGTQTLRTDSDFFRIYFGGSTGIGTAYKVSQTGEHNWDGASGATKMRLETDGDLHVDGDVIGFTSTLSDSRLKDNIKTIENATETVKQLRGVSYDWNSGSREGESEIGVIAQEVEKVLPNIVREKTLIDGTDVKTVDYVKIIGLLIESNKELSDRLDKLEK